MGRLLCVVWLCLVLPVSAAPATPATVVQQCLADLQAGRYQACWQELSYGSRLALVRSYVEAGGLSPSEAVRDLSGPTPVGVKFWGRMSALVAPRLRGAAVRGAAAAPALPWLESYTPSPWRSIGTEHDIDVVVRYTFDTLPANPSTYLVQVSQPGQSSVLAVLDQGGLKVALFESLLPSSMAPASAYAAQPVVVVAERSDMNPNRVEDMPFGGVDWHL